LIICYESKNQYTMVLLPCSAKIDCSVSSLSDLFEELSDDIDLLGNELELILTFASKSVL
jgi:hypothetical protein